MKTKMFFIYLTVFIIAGLISACGGSSEPTYEGPQDWKAGKNYAGTWDGDKSKVWFMETALVDIVQDKMNKIRDSEGTTNPKETVTPQTAKKENELTKDEFANLPLINGYGQMLGFMENPDPDHPLKIEIFQEGFSEPIVDVVLDCNQPGKHFRAASYLLPGVLYTRVLTPISDLACAETKEIIVTAFEKEFFGKTCFWYTRGGIGDWGQHK